MTNDTGRQRLVKGRGAREFPSWDCLAPRPGPVTSKLPSVGTDRPTLCRGTAPLRRSRGAVHSDQTAVMERQRSDFAAAVNGKISPTLSVRAEPLARQHSTAPKDSSRYAVPGAPPESGSRVDRARPLAARQIEENGKKRLSIRQCLVQRIKTDGVLRPLMPHRNASDVE